MLMMRRRRMMMRRIIMMAQGQAGEAPADFPRDENAHGGQGAAQIDPKAVDPVGLTQMIRRLAIGSGGEVTTSMLMLVMLTVVLWRRW
jgi:hypothetical protein